MALPLGRREINRAHQGWRMSQPREDGIDQPSPETGEVVEQQIEGQGEVQPETAEPETPQAPDDAGEEESEDNQTERIPVPAFVHGALKKMGLDRKMAEDKLKVA